MKMALVLCWAPKITLYRASRVKEVTLVILEGVNTAFRLVLSLLIPIHSYYIYPFAQSQLTTM